MQPKGAVAAAHVHPFQEERFQVLKGTIGFRSRKEIVRGRPGSAHHDPGRHAAQVLERGRRGGALRLRDPPSPRLRAADRDDVLARRRRQDEQAGDAEPAPPRGDRTPPLRRRPAPVPPGGAPAVRAWRSARRSESCSATARPTSRRPRRATPSPRRLTMRRRGSMRRRLFWAAVVLALLALALAGALVRALAGAAAARPLARA